MKAETRGSFEDPNPVRSLPPNVAPLADVVLDLPAVVLLKGEWVAIIPTHEGVNKYSIHVEEEDGQLRSLTPDEALALAVSPGTPAERTAAAERLRIPGRELRLVLLPQPWQRADLEVVLLQLKRSEAR
jgi:hypothetical protein